MKLYRLFFLLIGLLLSIFSFAQNDTCQLRISLLTCGPGEELYSTFGHSAMRITDKASNLDIVYNYGTFEFGPDFYMKFTRGKLNYFLSIQAFSDFVNDYREDMRGIWEQPLQLSCEEKHQLFDALQLNSLDANK